jgi:hypothetical protein
MSRAVHASSLTVGRCFYARPVQDDWAASPPAGSPLADKRYVFKIESMGDSIGAVSATGERVVVPAQALVVEVPRAGFDKLAK